MSTEIYNRSKGSSTTSVNPKPSVASQASKTPDPQEDTSLSRQILKDIKKDLYRTPGLTFAGFPKQVRFETQESQEEIILLLRRHVITNIPWLFIALIMSLGPLLFANLSLIELIPVNFQIMSILIWYLFVVAFILESFLSWYFNVYIVTDERLIDVDFFSLIYKRISEAKIDRIEDISYSQGGFIQSIFNYGTINIQTAGEIPEFDFDLVPQPARIVKVLNQLVLQEEQEKIEGRVR